MPSVHLVIDFSEGEAAFPTYRAERALDLQAVPRVGEIIWAGKLLALSVRSVVWLIEEEPDKSRPWLWLTRSEGTSPTIVDDGGTLKIPTTYVEQLRDAGWAIKEEF